MTAELSGQGELGRPVVVPVRKGGQVGMVVVQEKMRGRNRNTRDR
jgi:hypothetical protein